MKDRILKVLAIMFFILTCRLKVLPVIFCGELGVNLDFEFGDLRGWTVWGYEGEVVGSGWNGIPAHGGNYFFGVESQEVPSFLEGGIYQQIGVKGEGVYTVSAWIRGMSSDQLFPVLQSVGIDPIGGTDPYSKNVVWFTTTTSVGKWLEIKVSTAVKGAAGVITIFLRFQVRYGVACFDDVSVSYADRWDDIPPAVVKDLKADKGEREGEVILSWSAPGDDGAEGNLTGEYRIQYSTFDGVVWDRERAQVVISTKDVVPGSLQVVSVSGLLLRGTTYYFALWSADEVYNWSDRSNIARVYIEGVPIPGPGVNLDFEFGDLTGWTVWGTTGSVVDSGWNGIDAHGGKYFFGIDSDRDILDGGIYQQIIVEEEGNYVVSAWILGIKKVEYSMLILSVGIDPTGGTDPKSKDVVWANYFTPDSGNNNIWMEIRVSTTVRNTEVFTVFLRFKVRDAIACFDDVSYKVEPLDEIPPGKVTDLSAQPGSNPAEVVLLWTAPGDDGTIGTAAKYDIRYLTEPIDDSNWGLARRLTSLPVPSTGGTIQRWTVASTEGLLPGVSYYFALKAADEANNWSEVSNSTSTYACPQAPSGDDIPPARVTDLSALPTKYLGEVLLVWTAPGDDGTRGNLTGQYKIQYSTTSEIQWNKVNAQITISTSNVIPGMLQAATVKGLTIGVSYYFVVWSCDEVFNWSELSNIAGIDTTPPVSDLTPPAQVTDLVALPGRVKGEVKLLWTAPGDDGTRGSLTGQYKIQYSTYSDISWRKEEAQITISTNNVAPGTLQLVYISNLPTGVSYYFVLWTCDDVPLWSSRSNITFIFLEKDTTTVLLAPTLLSPVDGAVLTTVRPTFRWSQVSAPFRVIYSLQVDDDYNFVTPEVNVTSLTATSYTPIVSLRCNTTYYWRVEAVSEDGEYRSGWSEVWKFYIYEETITPVITPAKTELYPPMPNIVKKSDDDDARVRLKYAVSERGKVEIKIYNIVGELVISLIDEETKDIGVYDDTVWDLTNVEGDIVSSGIYIVYFKVGNKVDTQKVVVVR